VQRPEVATGAVTTLDKTGYRRHATLTVLSKRRDGVD
jgi:hypothetical protein